MDTKLVLKTFLILFFIIMLNLIQAQFKNIRVSNNTALDPEEPAIAINYSNPSQIAAASNTFHFYGSNDSGKTWNQKNITSTLGVWGDPSLVYDTKGNLYFAHLSNPSSGKWLDRIVVQKSTDNGLTWNDGVGVGTQRVPKIEDKEWITADVTNSSFRDNLYMCWTERDKFTSSDPNDSSRILFSRSTDGGDTWKSPQKISDRSGLCNDDDNTVEGAVPAVGPDGQVYVAWAGPMGIMFDKSYDGGITWGKDIFVNNMPGGWDFNISGLQWGNGMPVTVCDISNSPYRGHIYIMWGDTRNGETNQDIFIAKSTDEGETWSQPVRVNDDASKRPQFYGWVCIDQTTGYVYVSFYDRRNTTGNDTDYYLARSTNGGASFTNFKINAATFTPTTDKFFGDYTNIAAFNGKIYPIWSQMIGNELSIWMSIINDNDLVTDLDYENSLKPKFQLNQNYPNPFNNETLITYSIKENTFVKISIFDPLGRTVKTLVSGFQKEGLHEINFDSSALSSGLYLCCLEAGVFTESKKMILLK